MKIRFHYLVTIALSIFLVPAFRYAHLPLRFTWKDYFLIYWCSLGLKALAAAILLYALGFPREFIRNLTSRVGKRENPRDAALAIFLPAAYLFLMFILVFSYNDVIAVLRFNGSADVLLNRIDSWILGGQTVALITRSISSTWAKRFEFVYFLMFSQLGGTLILLALRCGRKTTMEFVGAIATAYYVGLLCFYFLPAAGPYYLSVVSGNGSYVGLGEKVFAAMLIGIQHHRVPQIVGTDYFIALPCLHISQPLIAMWFVRKWRPISAIFAVYLCFLVPSILLLQQHYVIDVIAGVGLAILSICLATEVSSCVYREKPVQAEMA